jgi:hypothetical protein
MQKWADDFESDPANTKLTLHDNVGCYIRTDSPQKRGMGMKTPLIWDSSSDSLSRPKTQAVETYIKWISGNKYKLVKVIPRSFFADAVFPVYTDTTSTFFPDSDPEATSVDGLVQQQYITGSGQSWTIIVNAVGSLFVDNLNFGNSPTIRADTVLNQWDLSAWNIYLFDTSSIPDGDTINSAIFSTYSLAKLDPGGITPNLGVYASNPASNTSLAAGDYDSFETTLFSGNVTYANVLINAYTDFSFIAAGLAAIDKTGVSKFGLLNSSYFIADSSPVWSSGDRYLIGSRFSEQAGTSQDPKLVVVHIASSPSVSPSASPSASISPSTSPSVSPSVSPSISPSASPSASASPSISPSVSPSTSPSVSPSASPSASASPSISPSVSPSTSPSVSPSASPSSSASPSASPSVSPSVSPSLSPSTSPSISLSASPSASASPSTSPSTSISPSSSPSVSPSASPSVSPSVSPSASPSVSPSSSPSVSPSASPSAEIGNLFGTQIKNITDYGKIKNETDYGQIKVIG